MIYQSELKTVLNKKTKKIFYFILCCDVWKRVSKKDYQDRDSIAERSDSFITKIKGDLIHQFKTIYFDVKINRGI